MHRFRIVGGFAATLTAAGLAVASTPLATAAPEIGITNSVSPSQLKTTGTGETVFEPGVKLVAHAWIAPFGNLNNCGKFATSVKMNRRPRSITNKTSFYEVGASSVSIGPVNIESSRKGPKDLEWTNDNGSKGSYLNGEVCGGFGSIFLGVDVTGSALWNGVNRTVNAHI